MKPVILLAVILLSLSADAQVLKGTVMDSTGSPVSYASVNLRNAEGSVIMAFTTADARGNYALRLPSGLRADTLYLEARCIGYSTQRRAVSWSTGVADFTLAVSASRLPSVIIHAKGPRLRTSGDTLSYKVSDFSSAQDRVIGDVIRRLPGISVASDGTIRYNNKPVSGVYLGGDNLLDDKYTIATNTIPQGVVDQVQVIDNHQPVKVLQNKVKSDDVALNLTFKKGAKARLLGQETAGTGLPGNYDADLNALLVKDKYKAIDYLKGNNTGEDLQQELVSHNVADYKLRIGNDPPAALLSLGSVNDPALARNRYFFNQSGLLNLNNLVNLKNGLQLRVNASYLHDIEKRDYSQRTSVFLPGDTLQYAETQQNRFHPNLLHAQLTLNVNKDKRYVNDALLLEDNRWADYSDLNTNGPTVHQVLRDQPRTFSNELYLMAPLGSKDLVQAYSYISRTSEPESRSIGPSYSDSLLIQTVNVPTWYTNNYVSWLIPGNIGTKSFMAGGSIQSQMLTSNLSPAIDSSTNHVAWDKKRLYGQAAYDIPGDNLNANLTLPLIFQQIDYSDAGYALDKRQAKLFFDPQVRIKYKTGREDFVTLLYHYRHQTGTVEDIYHGYILKDYRTLFANNADLTLKQDQLMAAGYSHRKALTLFFYSLAVSYERIHANNITSGVITDSFQQQVVLPYANTTGSWTADGSISKYSFPLRTTFTGEVKWQNSHSVQVQNGAFLPFNTTVWTLVFAATTKLSDQVNVSYQLTGTQTAAALAPEIDQLQQQGAIYYNLLSGMQFKLSGEHYFTRSQGNPDLQYFFADASVKYRLKKWKVDLQLDAVNFLNVRSYRALYLSGNMLTASSYGLPGRIVLGKIMFDL
ncbi:carboxypeptidase-like regulatory domain-containing protein [Dinghuibacter silviterrae]|uniref:Carboxypeptidase family protein n=1 Tax=Dinghuibacter silviterrae TaxID=1539049 RepID=A0A4R8DMQ8_9BACT|nr:carboxypeptidase-like regulatory domain-containing protein [Dinghuibacter silviterrae]TDW99048.1 carboxypeptidase family protein [Dinghuibacter silviterrae]